MLERIVSAVPAPDEDGEAPLRALIFDSYYDNYKGALCYVRIVDGRVRAGDRIRFMAREGRSR